MAPAPINKPLDFIRHVLLSDSGLREQMQSAPDAAVLHQLIAGWHSVHTSA